LAKRPSGAENGSPWSDRFTVSLTAASGTRGVPLVKPHSAPHHSVALLKKGEGGGRREEGGGRREKEDRKEERGERWMWLLTLMYVM